MKPVFTSRILMMAIAIAMLSLGACKSQQKVIYIEDIQPNQLIALQEERPIRLRPGDRLNITVHSRDKEIVSMFNIGNNNGSSSSTTTNSSEGYGNNASYTVAPDGTIDMPVLGPINVEGLTRLELANLIKYKLLAGKLVRDPVVNVSYAGMGYYLIGEVGNNGRKEITRDKITLLEAIAEAGDLTLNGLHDEVLILRTVDGQQIPYRVDLTKVETLYSSPAFYVQQDDFIYVLPNQKRRNENDWNANATYSPTFWVSMASLAATIIFLFVKK